MNGFFNTEKDILGILLDDDHFSQGLILLCLIQQLPWECAVCLHSNGKQVVLTIDLFRARYFEEMENAVQCAFCVLANKISYIYHLFRIFCQEKYKLILKTFSPYAVIK